MRDWVRTTLAAGVLATFVAAQPLLLTHLVRRGATATKSCADTGLRNIDDLFTAIGQREPLYPQAMPELRQMIARASAEGYELLRVQRRLDMLGADEGWSGITIFTAPELALQVWEDNDHCVATQYHVLAGYAMLLQYTRPKGGP